MQEVAKFAEMSGCVGTVLGTHDSVMHCVPTLIKGKIFFDFY